MWWEASGKSGRRGPHRRLGHNSGERQEGKSMRFGGNWPDPCLGSPWK